MHLSKTLQKQLKKIGSSIELAKTFDNTLPSNYVFYEPNKARDFRVGLRRAHRQFTVVLLEKTGVRDFVICYFRGIFTSMNELAKAIKHWVEDEYDIDKIATRFPNLEKYIFDEFENPNPIIEARWKYVRNRFFEQYKFWEGGDREIRYFKMVDHAKRRDEWKNYYPFTSHYSLRFSLTDEISHTWVLSLNIVPTWCKTNGNYRVAVPQKENKAEEDFFYFEKLEEALDFYSVKLKEHQPIKWR